MKTRGTLLGAESHTATLLSSLREGSLLFGINFMEWQRLEHKDIHFFRALLSCSDSPIVITDALEPDNPIVYVNPAFERATGYAASEVRGRNCRFLQGNDVTQEEIFLLVNAVSRGEPCTVTLRNYHKDGSLFWNELHLFPLRNPTGVITNFVGIQHDVTTAQSDRAALIERQLAIDHSLDVYLKVAGDGTVLEANNAVWRVFGWVPEELIGKSMNCLALPQHQGEFKQHLVKLFSSRDSQSTHGEYRRKDGATVMVEWSVSCGAGTDSIVCFGRDITDKHRLEQEAKNANERLNAILNSITEGCFSVNSQWQCTYINAQGSKWLNTKAKDLVGKNLWEEFPEAIGGPFYQAYHRAMDLNTFVQFDAYYPTLDTWFEARAYPFPGGLTVFFIDISERKRDEAKLIYAATHDPLTGLLNRSSCLKELQHHLETARSTERCLALLFIDLDRFKEVNDAFGHRIGDQTLVMLAQRLIFMSNNSRIPARISGDEFIFILQDITPAGAKAFADQLISTIAAPVVVDGIEVTVSASIGIAMAGDGGISPDELINQADTAMYASKDAGRHTAKVFSPAIDIWSKRRLRLRQDIPHAIRDGQFVVHYEPQIRLSDNKVVGAEALVRWQHPGFGLLSPNVFLGIAEESSLILELGMWIFEEVCRQMAEWAKLGRHLEISVNLSARQLGDSALPTLIERVTRRHDIDPQFIKLEVTESMLAQDFRISAQVLEDLKNKGFKIALDDFGTGYSNFTYLDRFPVTAIKVDRSFIENIERNENALALVNGIIAMAKSLDLTVICEGVESSGQSQALRDTGCDVIQGYLAGKAVSGNKFLRAYMHRNTRTLNNY